jgi:hypothetical protein
MQDLHAIKDVKDFLVLALKQVSAAKKDDGKISTMEAMQMLFTDLPKGLSLLSEVKDFEAEVKGLSLEDAQAMAAMAVEIMQAVSEMFKP